MPYKLNIPQKLVEFRDGGLTFRNDYETITTKSILIIGKAQDGPLDPVAVSIDTVSKIFGKDVDSSGIANGGTITTAVNDAFRAGCRDIRAMKISGSSSKATVQGPAKNVSIVEKKEIALGLTSGNDSTTVVLNNSGVIQSSIAIFVEDKALSCNFEFTSATSTITIPAGVCEAGKAISVKYEYEEVITDVPFEETLIVATNKTIILDKTPKTGSIVVTLNDVVVPSSSYAVTEKTITFSEPAKKNRTAVLPNDIVTVNYLSEDTEVRHSTDTEKDGVSYITATSVQVIALPEVPNKGTVILYCDDKEVSKKAYAVSGQNINVKKELLPFAKTLVATYLVSLQENSTATIEFESFFTSSIYNGGSVEVAEILNSDNVLVGKEVIITKPAEKQAVGELPLRYSSLAFPTLGRLVDAINSDLRGGVYKASTFHVDELTSSLNAEVVKFKGGDSGLNATLPEIKEALSGKRDDNGYLLEEGVYQILEGYNCDYIVLTGVYADDIIADKEGFAYDLAMHCAMSSHKNKTIFGSIAVKPCRNTSLRGIKEYVDRLSKWNADGKEFLLKEDGKIIKNENGKPIDLGMYVRVCGGTEPFYLNDDLGKHPANPAIAYTALQATLVAQRSALNKMVSNSKGLTVSLTEAQANALTRANIITFKQKQTSKGGYRDEVFVVDSMTQALPDSDYVRTTSCEVVRLISDDTRELSDPFIGEPPTIEGKNAFASSLSKRFSQRKQEGAIYDLSFEIIETPQMALMGDCTVNITIVTAGERRRINTTVGLKPML